MEMSSRETWTVIHGMVLGAVYLLAFTGGFIALWDFRSAEVSEAAEQKLARRLICWTWAMAVLVWLTVILGTYMIYPWYRAKAPAGASGTTLAHYPKYLLISTRQTSEWHHFGMEWKEHVAWLAPILATAVAVIVTRHWRQLARDANLRRAVLLLYTTAFFCSGIAGALGALINKVAPVR